jgi:hypothetical protein
MQQDQPAGRRDAHLGERVPAGEADCRGMAVMSGSLSRAWMWMRLRSRGLPLRAAGRLIRRSLDIELAHGLSRLSSIL